MKNESGYYNFRKLIAFVNLLVFLNATLFSGFAGGSLINHYENSEVPIKTLEPIEDLSMNKVDNFKPDRNMQDMMDIPELQDQPEHLTQSKYKEPEPCQLQSQPQLLTTLICPFLSLQHI